jgi:hypothetical protein
MCYYRHMNTSEVVDADTLQLLPDDVTRMLIIVFVGTKINPPAKRK